MCRLRTSVEKAVLTLAGKKRAGLSAVYNVEQGVRVSAVCNYGVDALCGCELCGAEQKINAALGKKIQRIFFFRLQTISMKKSVIWEIML